VHVYDGVDSKYVMRIAATAERFSEHPLAKAIVRKAADWSLTLGEPAAFRYSSGKGVVCEVENERTLIGSRALLEQEGVPTPDRRSSSERFSEVLVAAGGGSVANSLRGQ
jgi:Cu+-exporting ATPase